MSKAQKRKFMFTGWEIPLPLHKSCEGLYDLHIHDHHPQWMLCILEYTTHTYHVWKFSEYRVLRVDITGYYPWYYHLPMTPICVRNITRILGRRKRKEIMVKQRDLLIWTSVFRAGHLIFIEIVRFSALDSLLFLMLLRAW